MFGWLFPAKCPVPPDRKAWIESGLNWLGEQFGPRMLTRAVVLPTPEYFPDPYDNSPRAAEAIFERVCRYMEVPRERVVLTWFVNDETVPRHLREGRSQGAAGLYGDDGSPGPKVIELEESLLADPTALVGTMAHELAHVHLLGDRRLSHDSPDHEPLTDLLTVLYGLGLFTANSVLRESHWKDGAYSGWSVGRQGYLTGPEYGYAFALVARARNEPNPAWAPHLRPDVRSPLKAGLRYLRTLGAAPFPRPVAPAPQPADGTPWASPAAAPPAEPSGPSDDVPWTRPKPAADDWDDEENLPPWMRGKGR